MRMRFTPGFLAGGLLAVVGLAASIVLLVDVFSEPVAAQAAVPRGTVIAWYAKSGPFPTGWAICDGTNGTPDLRGRYVQGVAALAEIGRTPGSATHQHNFRATSGDARTDPDGWNAMGMNRPNPPHSTGLDHSHAVSGTSENASSLPPSVTLIYLMKK